VTARCKPCLFLLRDLARHSGNPALARIYAQYAATGDDALVAEAAAVASPAALAAARDRAVAAGVIPAEAIL
jgi:hypothetical protein